MCGILGQIKLKNDILRDTRRFVKSLNLMAHRGPDDMGYKLGEEYIFGHRRLSIIDLSKNAAQPMISHDGKVIITFNGEIYNFMELRNDLLKKGYHFKSKSDTEVLLNGYHCFGIDFINRCNGMFGLAIYDKRFNKAFLVRDRMGIKPLYYCIENNRLTFSSEIKSILAYEDITSELNMDAVSSYLSFRYPILSDTFFKGIFSLDPGHYIEINEGKIRSVKYWDPTDKIEEQNNDKGESFYLDMLRKTFQSSVKYRMLSDVPVGAFLSGGIDSSAITAVMSELTNDPVKTFTIGYGEKDYNEFYYANLIATMFKSEHYEIRSDETAYFENLDNLIDIKDAPLSIPNEVPHYELCCNLKKNATVVLTGGGADEIFYGYGRIFRSTYDYERLKRLDLISNNGSNTVFAKNFKAKYGRLDFENELEHFMNIYDYTGLEMKKKLLNSSCINFDETSEKFKAKFLNIFNEIKSGTYLDKMGHAFLKVHLPGILLHNDVISMATSVELRVPYLDHRLVEFSLSVPVHYKLKWKSEANKLKSAHLMSDKISENYDTPKYLLRKAYENKIPREIINRKKLGFPVPLHQWLGGNYRKYAAELLLSDKAKKREIYNTDNLKKWLGSSSLQHYQGDSRTYQDSLAGKIWMLMNLEIFLKKYFD